MPTIITSLHQMDDLNLEVSEHAKDKDCGAYAAIHLNVPGDPVNSWTMFFSDISKIRDFRDNLTAALIIHDTKEIEAEREVRNADKTLGDTTIISDYVAAKGR